MIQSAAQASHAASEALFGSLSRGDADAMSDRDVLIVDDDIDVLRSRGAQLTRQGASVASYTFSKLEALAAQGALFLQHLKLEARIDKDRGSRLSNLLHEFRPKNDYSREINDNAGLAALAGVVPYGPRGLLFAADVLYVSARNYGVLALAQGGIHVYSFNEVVAELENQGLIIRGGASALSSLRSLKCLYRSRKKPRGEKIEEVIRKSLEVLPQAYFPSKLLIEDPRSIVLMSRPLQKSAYVELRDLERRWLGLLELDPNLLLRGRLLKLQSWIENPRAYTSVSARLSPVIRRDMKRLAQSAYPLDCSGREMPFSRKRSWIENDCRPSRL